MNKIQQEAIAGHKTAIAVLQSSIEARENCLATQSYKGKLPFFVVNQIHQKELFQLELLQLELTNMEALYGTKS